MKRKRAQRRQADQVTVSLSGVTLRSALKLMLKEIDLTYVIRDEVLKITTPEEAENELLTKVYPVADLVLPILSGSGGMGMMGGMGGGMMGGRGGGISASRGVRGNLAFWLRALPSDAGTAPYCDRCTVCCWCVPRSRRAGEQPSPPSEEPAMHEDFARNLRLLCSYYRSVAEVCRRLEINRPQFNRSGALRRAEHRGRIRSHRREDSRGSDRPRQYVSRYSSSSHGWTRVM